MEDAPAVLALKRDAIRAINDASYSDAELRAWAPGGPQLETFASAIVAEQFHVLIAEIGETIVGYGVLNAADQRIEALFVDPDWNRSGVGTTLVRQLEVSATLSGSETVAVIASRNAVEFYESLGYDRDESRIRSMTDQDLTFVRMVRTLTG